MVAGWLEAARRATALEWSVDLLLALAEGDRRFNELKSSFGCSSNSLTPAGRELAAVVTEAIERIGAKFGQARWPFPAGPQEG